MKIMITGSGGYIGRFLTGYFRQKGFDLIGVDIKRLPSVNELCDISKYKEFMSVMNKHEPDIVIHCGAIKDIEYCQSNRVTAWQTNVGSSNAIVQYLIKRPAAKGIYISSDIVFDGCSGSYAENCMPNPINWYGITKFHGELLFSRLENHSICRTSLVIGDLSLEEENQLAIEIANGYLKNQSLFPFYVYLCCRNGDAVGLSDDTVSSPTHLRLIAQAIEQIIVEDGRGTFHLSGSEPISRLQFAKKIARFHDLSENNLVASDDFCSDLRPKNVGLDVRNTYRELGLNLDDWTVDKMLEMINWTLA